MPAERAAAARIDAALRLHEPTSPEAAGALAAALRAQGIAGALAFLEFDDEEGQEQTLAAFSRAAPHVRCVPRLDPARPRAIRWQRRWAGLGAQAISLSRLGAAYSPLRPPRPGTVAAAAHWTLAASHGQVVCVEPGVEDAGLLVPLAVYCPQVRVLVRGGLVSRMPAAADVQSRQFPTPDRFTFDRMHQLGNVWLVLVPSASEPVARVPAGKPAGWHAPGNLLALYSSKRILWGSNRSPGQVVAGAVGLPDPVEAFGELTTVERLDLTGRSARGLFAHA